MSLSVQIGTLLLSLSLTTLLILILSSDFDPLQIVRALFIWRFTEWSFDAGWFARRQLAAFTLLYALFGLALLTQLIPLVALILAATVASLICTLADRRIAHEAQHVGIPPRETQSLSNWRFFNAQKAHDFTRHIEEGEIAWVPSTLTTLSVTLLVLALGLLWLALSGHYEESASALGIASALTVSIPPILTCMLGPTPRLFDRNSTSSSS